MRQESEDTDKTIQEPKALWTHLIESLMKSEDANDLVQELDSELFQNADLRYFTFSSVFEILGQNEPAPEIVLSNAILLLSSIKFDLNPKEKPIFFLKSSASNKKISSVDSNKMRAQEAWLSVFKQSPNTAQINKILSLISTKIAPWFAQPEMLMDFLTASFNVGGSTALQTLSGLWYLMRERNLDYPSFYSKLYSLLDDKTLHSRHRSQFLRLMNIFLSSSHLPAVLVASFMKRLSRLALTAPPGGIAFIIPWVYNMVKRHPAVSFMIHREVTDKKELDDLREHGLTDPYDMQEPNPMETKAIDSSLWELVMLQSHYHPNIASLTKIISEPFTKERYDLEDFLGVTYVDLIEDDLGRKKTKTKIPVVEYEIPKRILTRRKPSEPALKEESLLVRLWDFN
jgi:U3 small nucleolar RNA-associated protein 19